MDDLGELYQQVILDHNRRPRHFGKLTAPSRSAEGHNPICGDHITVYVRTDGDQIAEVSFEGSGCAISRASASLMTQAVSGKPAQEAEKLFRDFQAMVTGDPAVATGAREVERLGKLAALAGVRAFPSRIKCATLAWHALHAALSEAGSVSTE
ncbi:MAG: SUF system NifU family Fe-S cluster assembly protein [Gemmatimonadetes bacterium]|nr:SUF system NifU family Fe-S cluster assembly protein [Gemmatimonadota bacterium]